MIQIENLNKTYQHKNKNSHVLSGVNLDVAAGEIFGIIGKSGAGKSTLLKCINLLETPDSGKIVIDGVDLSTLNKSQLRQARQKIGMIFQGFNLLRSKTVFANVALPLILSGKYSKTEIKDRVEQLLELVGLVDLSSKHPDSLSGGQKQRVGIARALATNPKILLSDEATSALDPQTTNSILELLLDINQKLGVTIVLITHEIEVVRKICDKVAVIDNGVIIESGNTVDIILHPKHELTRRLIIEEESHKYLEQVADFYQFTKTAENHLLLLSFVGDQTFAPIIGRIMRITDLTCNILHGELGRIKRMPFGQLLLDVNGTEDALRDAFAILKTAGVHYEIIQ